ncbi:MAG: formate--tetrahydrofolate ligase [Bdellovibrionota bacterium]
MSPKAVRKVQNANGAAKALPAKPLTDLEIAHATRMRPVTEIAEKLGLSPEHLHYYGQWKAKVDLAALEGKKLRGKLILVSAMTPTPLGEGKTTTTIGLGQALAQLGKHTAIALREPSLGPCMGIKGGATGGGYSQVLPMEDINLHFTGDIHAVSSAHNLLAACIDNSIFHANKLNLDPRRVIWPRVIDLNDRSLRDVVIGLGGAMQGVPRESGFHITAASEVMAILCLSKNYVDLKERLSRIVIGFTYKGEPVTVKDLGIAGALAALLAEALRPNLVQTIEGVPAFVHGGPFANIAQGTNTVLATKMALSYADRVVTEAGFGFDLGGEKFLDIKCRSAGISPQAVVLVATCRALRLHGGIPASEAGKKNDAAAVRRGLANLGKHLENVGKFGLSAVVAINHFPGDSEEELAAVRKFCDDLCVPSAVSDIHAKGGKGGLELARLVEETISKNGASFKPLYELSDSITRKIETVAREIYGAGKVEYAEKARKDMAEIQRIGLEKLPICIAKTQQSISDKPELLGAPSGYTLTVREVHISAGAGFLVPITGNMLRMPGLPEKPAALGVDIDEKGRISGLF